ncbi:hypothetical protein C2G38_2181359 [Gigaspora rosea]|uniref:Highly derived d5-like helicase-primase: PROVISIONAL n=1 Tax=Gigaspora rosea TaxID=44941 RepID=A0A397VKD0_9GLOM|nr:hypothetical protein C2G38_2181359 [Gigaspora rosea]
MSPKLDIAKYEISLVELEREAVKLTNLIDRAVTKGLIRYQGIDFLPYSPLCSTPKTKFFNLFLGFKAPVNEIDSSIIDPIIWHIENVWCSRDKVLLEYVLNWFSYLVQYSGKKPGTVLVLCSSLRLGKNILIDFIGKKVLGPKLFFTTSDLGKANDHLISLITEPYVMIECKGLEPKTIKDFAGYMVLSNHDALLRVKIGDGRIVCLDVSPCCKENIEYFKRLEKILDNPKTSGRNHLAVLFLERSFHKSVLIEHPDLPENETVDIPIFNVPEITLSKTALSQQAEAPVASTSRTFKTSEPPETVNKKPEANRMMSDADAIEFAKEDSIDINEIFYISRRERLISEEIYLHNLEDARKPEHMFMIMRSGKKVLVYFKRTVSYGKSPKLQVNITEDIGTIYDGDFELDPLVRFFYPALIPPRIIWEEEEVKAWRNDVLIKFLHHPNLASSKHRPGALYDVFIKTIQGFRSNFELTTNPQRGQDPYPYRPHHLTQKWELHRFWSVNSCEEVANKCSQIEALLSSDSEIGALEILG